MAFNQSTMYGTGTGLAAGRRGFDVGSLGGLAGIALGREGQALQQAQGQAQQQAQQMTAGGANPFAAGRAAMASATQAQAGIRAQTDERLAQLAEQERQIRAAEEERKRQQASQLLAGGLSTAGAVIGSIVPGLGTAIGGGLGSAVGGGLGSALGGAAPGGDPSSNQARVAGWAEQARQRRGL